MSNFATSAARKTDHYAYILSDGRVVHCSSEAALTDTGRFDMKDPSAHGKISMTERFAQ